MKFEVGKSYTAHDKSRAQHFTVIDRFVERTGSRGKLIWLKAKFNGCNVLADCVGWIYV